MHKVRGHRKIDVFEQVRADLLNGEQLNVTDYVEEGRVNYPNNCYDLDLSSSMEVQEGGINTLLIWFSRSWNWSSEESGVQIEIKGGTLSCGRSIFDHTFYSTGDTIEAKHKEIKKYAMEISENVFVEEDPTKSCRVYPNEEFESYCACDDQFMKVTKCLQSRSISSSITHIFFENLKTSQF